MSALGNFFAGVGSAVETVAGKLIPAATGAAENLIKAELDPAYAESLKLAEAQRRALELQSSGATAQPVAAAPAQPALPVWVVPAAIAGVLAVLLVIRGRK